MDELNLTAVALGEAIRKGETTAPAAVEAVLAAIEAKDPATNAYLTVNAQEARMEAEAVQKRIAAGELAASPLAGVPVAIKDNICTKGLRTTCASKILGDFCPPYDATVISRLKAAGAIVLGKTNMDEFAMGSTSETSALAVTKNPFDLSRVPGGSSGGSAAAVAARTAVCALGSDTGGSIRQPASYCGVTGIKPTYGTVSRFGLIAYASSLDQIGPIAKDVRDCAALLDVISGKDSRDGTSLDLPASSYFTSLQADVKGKRLALPRQCFAEGLQAEVRERVLAAADTFRRLGAVVEEIDLPVLQYVIPTYYIIAAAEASSNLSRFDGVKYGFRSKDFDGLTDMYAATRSEGFGEEVKKRILLGTFVLSSGYYDAYYRKALQVKAVIKQSFDRIFAEYDAILSPVAPTTAPKLGESLSDPLKMYLSDIFTVSVNLAGLPGISLPCGVDAAGLPVGVQLIGPALGEQKILDLGYAYQTVTDFHKNLPEVIA